MFFFVISFIVLFILTIPLRAFFVVFGVLTDL